MPISFSVRRAISSIHKGFHLWILDFLSWYGFMYWAGGMPALFVMLFSARWDTPRQRLFGCLLWCGSLRYFGYFHIPDKAVIDNYSLGSAFTCTLCFKHINVVNEFTQQRCGQSVHSHEPADCWGKGFTVSFALSAFGKLLTESFYFGFQFHPFYLVLVG